MTKKMRYSLLLGGFLLFLAAAPALVLYIQGRLPNFREKRAIDTGIIAIRTSPDSAKVRLNGEDTEEKTPAALRFLPSGDYEVSLEKPGYRPWTKRLSVLAGRVTHAGPEPEKLILIKDTPAVDFPTSNVVSFYTNNDSIITINKNPDRLEVLNKDGELQLSAPISFLPNQVITESNSDLLVLIGAETAAIFNLKTKKFSILPLNLTNLSNFRLHSGVLFWLDKDMLYAQNLKAQKPATLLASKVQSYEFFGDAIYFLNSEQSFTTLEFSYIESDKIDNRQTLASLKQNYTSPQILIDSSRAVFILDSGKLYRVNTEAEEIATGVTLANTYGGVLAYFLPGELWWYESSANRSHIISRRSDTYKEAYLDTKLQYILFTTEQELTALEIHADGGQNRYSIFQGQIQQMNVSEKSVLFLTSEGDLKKIELFP